MSEDFGRKELREIQTAALEALKQVAKDHGVEFSFAGGSFAGGEATLKFRVIKDGAESREVADWKVFAASYGLDPAWLGRELTGGYKIVGLNARAKKNVVLLEKGGKTYCGTARSVINELKK